jgi:hypothetical protein
MRYALLGRWRATSGFLGCASGCVLFGLALFQYERYANDLAGLHSAEMHRYALALSILWRLCFFGSPVAFIASAFGFGRLRGAGITVSLFAFACSLMVLGAICGPFMC